ncbi:hypothetical protein [Oceanobacillus sp. FSL H7-0719]|uniref:hypothetical protein n=1 Tax=Oceanobacillus sp. FSL H7-0719 TaxID=2954507 RepID=UPI003245D1FC
MAVYKISLMEAYQIETLHSNNLSNEQIIAQINQGNIEPWQALHEHFDFELLLNLANEDMNRFQEILESGYQVKFMTFNGLKNLLRMRFKKEQDRDYTVQERGINRLVLTEAELAQVKQMLSVNWLLTEKKQDADGFVVEIELV